MNIQELRKQMNQCGKEREPFLFLVDFEMKKPLFYINPLENTQLFFDFKGMGNSNKLTNLYRDKSIIFESSPISKEEYRKKFDTIYKSLLRGDSFLANLTVKSKIECNLTLEEIFLKSKAKYKIYLPDNFVCFSPETFVEIKDGKINSYPMKGTIDASIPDAEQVILNSAKESMEHNTIVDLIRNDLNQIANNVNVERFRYVEKIQSNKGEILQVSSKITGSFDNDYLSHLGDIVIPMLPAGSISGAPKRATIEAITSAENQERGYYTGIAGYFNGEEFSSAVLIRYIEEEEGCLYFRSGGGITTNSCVEEEYREIITKIYLPL